MKAKSLEQLFFMRRVEAARKAKGVSRPEVVGDLVESAKSQNSTYSDWLHGNREITLPSAITICRRVGIRPAWALFDAGPKTDADAATLDELHNLARELRAGDAYRLKGMPELKTVPFSTRTELPRVKLSLTKRVDFKPVKLFRDLAAGYGPGDNYAEMEHAFVEGLPGKGYTVARVRGDSMVATLEDGDFVLLKDFEEGGRELPRIESPSQKMPLDVWKREARIDDNDIVVVAIDALSASEGKTIKRVKYDTRRGKDNWKMLIAADNPLAWQDPWQVEVGDKLTFYGKLVALCEPVK